MHGVCTEAMGYAMDGLQALDLALFAAGAFAAAFVTGIAGFAFGVVAAAVWLHVLTPVQAAALIVVFGLIVQGWSVWKLRAALRWSRVLPFVIGGIIGVSLGAEVLRWTNPTSLRMAVGAILVLLACTCCSDRSWFPPLAPAGPRTERSASSTA